MGSLTDSGWLGMRLGLTLGLGVVMILREKTGFDEVLIGSSGLG